MWHSWLEGSDLAKDTGKMSPAGNPGRSSNSTMIASAHKEDGTAKPPESLEEIGPTLLTLPPELRNKIVSMHCLISDGLWVDPLTSACADQFNYVYNTTGTVAKSIDLDLFALRRVPAWRLLIPGAYRPAGSLGQNTSPPNKSPLLTCKLLHAEIHKMHVAAFRNYWTADAFNVKVCDTQPGVRDLIVHQHLRRLHHIAYNAKHLTIQLILHFVFRKGAWDLDIELSDHLYPGGLRVPVSDLRGYERFANLDEMSKWPTMMGQYRVRKESPLDPSVGEGFTFKELVFFLWLLDEVENMFDGLPRYCALSSL